MWKTEAGEGKDASHSFGGPLQKALADAAENPMNHTLASLVPADVLVLGLPDLANLHIPLGKEQADAKPGSMFSFGSVRFLLFRFWFSVPVRFRKLPLNYNHYTSIFTAPLIVMIYFLNCNLC